MYTKRLCYWKTRKIFNEDSICRMQFHQCYSYHFHKQLTFHGTAIYKPEEKLNLSTKILFKRTGVNI